jgi:hypothetical protein
MAANLITVTDKSQEPQADQPNEAEQTTEKGLQIPMPKRDAFFANLRKLVKDKNRGDPPSNS